MQQVERKYPSVWTRNARLRLFCLLLLAVPLPFVGSAAQVPVRYIEGLEHGFLVLRTPQGETLAHGDLTQIARKGSVMSHLAFRFRDGSLYDERTVYSQRRRFRLVSDHIIESGPTFPHPQDVSIDVPSGRATVRYTDDRHREEFATERMKLPTDLANGLIFVLIKNVATDGNETKASMVVTTPKPRLVTLVFSREGEDTLLIGGKKRQVGRFLIKIDLHGITGLIAPLLGKEPPPIHVWILDGEAPVFIKSEGPLYPGGPVWQIELESPQTSEP